MVLTCPPSGGETYEASQPRSKNLRTPHLLPGQSGNRAIGQLGNWALAWHVLYHLHHCRSPLCTGPAQSYTQRRDG